MTHALYPFEYPYKDCLVTILTLLATILNFCNIEEENQLYTWMLFIFKDCLHCLSWQISWVFQKLFLKLISFQVLNALPKICPRTTGELVCVFKYSLGTLQHRKYQTIFFLFLFELNHSNKSQVFKPHRKF